MTKLMQYTCPICSSRNLAFPAYSYWRVAVQRFELLKTFSEDEEVFCMDCHYEGKPNYTECTDATFEPTI